MENHKGIEQWMTADGVNVVQLHYSADPDKDPATPLGQAWLKEALKGYPGGMNDPRWRKEMEIDFYAFSGQLLFPFLIENESTILVDPITSIPPHWRLTAGFDYGTRSPSAFIVTGWDEYLHPTTLWEYYEAPKDKKESLTAFRARKGYKRTAKAIKTSPFYKHVLAGGGIIADSSIADKTQQTKSGLKSMQDLFAEEGLYFNLAQRQVGGDIAWYEMVSSRFWADPTKPLWKITKNCSWLWWELKGLRFKEWGAAASVDKNFREEVVDKNNHATDAIKYDFRMWAGQPAIKRLESINPAKQVMDQVQGKPGHNRGKPQFYMDFREDDNV